MNVFNTPYKTNDVQFFLTFQRQKEMTKPGLWGFKPLQVSKTKHSKDTCRLKMHDKTFEN